MARNAYERLATQDEGTERSGGANGMSGGEISGGGGGAGLGSGGLSAGGMPHLPPSYEELGNAEDDLMGGDNENTGSYGIEQFEIDDYDYDGDVRTERGSLFTRASFFTKKFAAGFSNRVIHPVTRMIDPIYEGLLFVNLQYERSILKIGNPLVVKRLLYVLFMVIIIFFVSRYTVSEGINGTSGGAFSSGKFYDLKKLGSLFEDHIDPRGMKETLEYFSSMPHVAGTSGDLALSKYVERFMNNNGVKSVGINELQSYLNYPSEKSKSTYVKLADDSFEATLREFGIDEMEYMAYNPNGLNTDGEVEGPMVFANYGSEDDINQLVDSGIDLKDTILLMYYGGDKSMPEPNKVALATDKGAKAVIFISSKFSVSTKDDKPVEHDDVIQRENVGNTRYSPGDVLTPGWASEDGYVSRLLWFKSKATPKIPSIPVSYKDGAKLIKQLDGTGYKFENGKHSGEGDTDDKSKRLKLKITNNEKQTHQIWNVVGSIPGREQHEKRIVIGAARDAACFGTISSNTGTVVMLELIKIFTTMQRKYNWSPARTITFISFDATNYNLAGLTEWIEEMKKEIFKEAYAYVDLSDAVAGDELSIRANPFLHLVIKDTLKDVQSSTKSKRADDHTLNMHELFKSQNEGLDKISNNLIEFKNYIPFINLLNVPSMEIKFKGNEYPKHSCFDSFDNFEKSNIDSKMEKHKQLVEILGKVILNSIEQAIIPYNFGEFVDRMIEYQSDLEKYIDKAIKADDKPNKPQMHYEKFTRSLNTLRESATQFDEWVGSWKKFIIESSDIEPSLVAMKRWKWNECLVEFNNNFISKAVQPARPGYLNLLFGTSSNAPANGNNDWQWNTFPAVRNYIDEGDFGRAQYELDQLADIMEMAAKDFVTY